MEHENTVFTTKCFTICLSACIYFLRGALLDQLKFYCSDRQHLTILKYVMLVLFHKCRAWITCAKNSSICFFFAWL